MRAIRGTFRHALYHEKLINYDKISDESEHFQTRPTPDCHCDLKCDDAKTDVIRDVIHSIIWVLKYFSISL